MLAALLDELLGSLPDGIVRDVRIGPFWTAVVTEVAGKSSCGLASTLQGKDHVHGVPSVNDAGHLTGLSARALAGLVRSESSLETCVGMATINALLQAEPGLWSTDHAGDLIIRHGAGKPVVLVGHFPFVDRLRQAAAPLWVLDLEPIEGDLPASAADQVIPQAQVLAITGTTLINRTLDRLMQLRRPDALVVLLGPSTPLSPILFGYGIDVIAGSVVEQISPVLDLVSQGANFRQLRRGGVRLVTMQRPGPSTTL
jgi:uncharacterized protein (DUF4213/DUF364 family)